MERNSKCDARNKNKRTLREEETEKKTKETDRGEMEICLEGGQKKTDKKRVGGLRNME